MPLGPSEWRGAVTINLAPEGGGEPQLSCACGSPACGSMLRLIDELLLLFRERADSAPAMQLLEAAHAPPWDRALVRLDRALAEVRRERRESAESILWWKIESDERGCAIHALVQERGKRGVKKPKRVVLQELLGERVLALSPLDREIAELAEAAAGDDHYGLRTHEHLLLRAFLKLVGHPRVVLDAELLEAVSVREGTIELCLEAEGDHVALKIKLDGRIVTSAQLAELLMTSAIADAIIEIDRKNKCVAVTRISPELRAAASSVHTLERGVPAAHRDRLLVRLPLLGEIAPVIFEGSIARRELRPERRVVLRLLPGSSSALEVQVYLRPLEGGPLVRPGEGPPELVASTPERELIFARRELAEEPAWTRTRLAELLPGLENAGRAWTVNIAELDDALDLVHRLERAEGITCEWPEDQEWRVTRAATPKDLRVRLEDRRDWFGLEGELDVDGVRISIAALLEAARKKSRFVTVDGKHWVAIGEILRLRVDSLEPYVFSGRAGLEVSPISAGEVEASVGDAAELSRPPRWRDALQRLEHYQIEGHAWLARLAACGFGACLADDMGLGKTVQTIAVLLDRASLGPALVVAPTSVTFNWMRELAAFAPGLRAILYRGADRRAALDSLGPADVVIASYGLLARDVEALAVRTFATLALDEAQAIKNSSSRRAKAARRIDAAWKVALTGTPLENHLGELWSIFHLISPMVLGSWEQFRERFAAPIERHRDPTRAQALSRLLRPFVLRRTKGDVAKDLPPRTEIRLDVVLSPKERAAYEDARLAAIARLADLETGLPEEQRHFHVLAALTRLRQLACHPRLADAGSRLSSSKLAALLDLVRALVDAGQRALVFSQFTQHLALVREALDKAGLPHLDLDGATPLPERARRVDRFQAGEAPLFLISLRAGGTGLNLTAADNVIILDPWWNPAVEDQAADRAHRIGQTRPVSVYRLVTRGTIEDSILDLHASKRALVADVLGGAGAAGAISTSELIELIKAGAHAAETAETAETADEPEETTDQEPERDEPAVSALIEPRAGAVALYEADLKRDVERGLLSASSARTYVRVAHRFIDMVEESGDASLMEDLEHALEMVAEWAERGELTKSMVPVARVVLRRMLPLWNGAVGPSARASARDQKS